MGLGLAGWVRVSVLSGAESFFAAGGAPSPWACTAAGVDPPHARAVSDATRVAAITECRARTRLLDDRELRGLNVEGFVLAAAPVFIRCGHRVANDSDGRISGDHPFGDPELTLRLLRRRPVTHRNIHDSPGVVQVNDELRGFLAISGLRIRDEHAEPDGFAALEAVTEEAIFRMARRLEHRHVAVDDQLVCRASGCGRRLERGRSLTEADGGAGGE